MALQTPGSPAESFEPAHSDTSQKPSRHGGVVLASTTNATQSLFAIGTGDNLSEQNAPVVSCHDARWNTELVADQLYHVPHIMEAPKRRQLPAGFSSPLQSESRHLSAADTTCMDLNPPRSKHIQEQCGAEEAKIAPALTPYSSVLNFHRSISSLSKNGDSSSQQSTGLHGSTDDLPTPKENFSRYTNLREHFSSKPNATSPERHNLGFMDANSTAYVPTSRRPTKFIIPGLGISGPWDSAPVSSPYGVHSGPDTSPTGDQRSQKSAGRKAMTQPLPSREFYTLSPGIRPTKHHLHSDLTIENWYVPHGDAAAHMATVSPPRSQTSFHLAVSASPETARTNRGHDMDGNDSSRGLSTPLSARNTDEDPEPERVEAPVWRQRQVVRSWKAERVDRNRYDECFEGAFDVLGTLNADNYQMPYGSRVVSIKSVLVSNMLLSIRTGIWACPDPVSSRIVNLAKSRSSEEEKILFLFSVPGSKHFCGIAEMLSYQPGMSTDLWEGDVVYAGAMLVRWLYCKLVTYDEIKRNVVFDDNESVTQMWNGMHYPEPLGRKVVQAYIQAPHVENMITKPVASPSRGGRFPSKRGMTSGGRGGRYSRASAHQIHNQSSGNRVEPIDSRTSRLENKSSPTHTGTTQASQSVVHPHSDGKLRTEPLAEVLGTEQPKLQMVPFYVHADGTMTPAVQLPSSTGSFPQFHGDNAKTTLLPSVSTPNTPYSPYNFRGVLPSNGDTPKPRVGPGRIVGDTNRTHHLPPSAFFDGNSRSGSVMESLPNSTNRSSPNVAGHLQKDWRSGLRHDMAGQQTPTSERHATKRPAESPIAPASFDVHTSEQTISSPQGSIYKQHQSPMHDAYYETSGGDYLNQGVSLARQSPQVSQFFADVTDEHEHGHFSNPEYQRLTRSFPTTEVMERIATPKTRTATSFGHHTRDSEAGSSMDMRTQTWVDRLLASPGRRNDGIAPFGNVKMCPKTP